MRASRERGGALFVVLVISVPAMVLPVTLLVLSGATRRAVAAETAGEKAVHAAELSCALLVRDLARSVGQALPGPRALGPAGTIAGAALEDLGGGLYAVEGVAKVGEAARRVRVTVQLGGLPFDSALHALAEPGGGGLAATLSGEGFLISGVDRDLQGRDTGAPLPGLRVRDAVTASALSGKLGSAQLSSSVEGLVGSVALPFATDDTLATAHETLNLARRIEGEAAVSGVVLDGLDVSSGTTALGTTAAPEVTHVRGDLVVRSGAKLTGAGTLLVDGALEVKAGGSLTYAGLVLVRGAGVAKLLPKSYDWAGPYETIFRWLRGDSVSLWSIMVAIATWVVQVDNDAFGDWLSGGAWTAWSFFQFDAPLDELLARPWGWWRAMFRGKIGSSPAGVTVHGALVLAPSSAPTATLQLGDDVLLQRSTEALALAEASLSLVRLKAWHAGTADSSSLSAMGIALGGGR